MRQVEGSGAVIVEFGTADCAAEIEVSAAKLAPKTRLRNFIMIREPNPKMQNRFYPSMHQMRHSAKKAVIKREQLK